MVAVDKYVMQISNIIFNRHERATTSINIRGQRKEAII